MGYASVEKLQSSNKILNKYNLLNQSQDVHCKDLECMLLLQQHL